MRKTMIRETGNPRITVDLDTLAAMLSCGTATARKIAAEAGASVTIGRRVLYSVDKVKKYIDLISV